MSKFNKAALTFSLFFCLLALLSSNSYAIGALFSRPRFSTSEYKKMWIKKIDTKVDIQEQIAVTHVDQTFNNELGSSVETIFIFPLPPNATVSELVYWVGGVRFVAEVRERQDAVNAYNQKLRQWLDPALLEYLGNNLFRLSIVPIAAYADVRTEITYVEPLEYDFGTVKYKFRLNTLELSSKPLNTVAVNLTASSKCPYKKFISPSHANSTGAKLTKLAENAYSFFYGDENFYPDKDLTIEFETMRDNIEVHALSCKPSVADSIGTDSYYALWITPPDSLTSGSLIAKDIVFTADVSSSMDGERIAQIKEALNNFLILLNPEDKFNIITFGTFVKTFKPDLVAASANNIKDAKDFVFQLYALGMTNIDQALTTSLQQSYNDSTSNNLVFLTDGYPTLGDTLSTSILSHVHANNKKNVRIFSFGVGEDLSKSLLTNLADENHGFSRFITSDDSIALVINDHFKRISKPVLTDIAIDMGGLPSYDIYPKIVNDLFWGNQLKQFGLYTTGGTYNITIKGKIRSNPIEFTTAIDFVSVTGGHKFVPRLWAKEKIDYLLKQIEVFGETAELKKQIIELSLRYHILTVYTAFYVDPSTDIKNNKDNNIPEEFALGQNYPNPFNPETKISYSLPAQRSGYNVIIRIYNSLGQLIRTLVNAQQAPGNYTIIWNGKDAQNHDVPSGIYIYTIQTEGFKQVRKMILLK
ncbi:MAG: VIT domain-containing protein [Methanococcaceae archaeon]